MSTIDTSLASSLHRLTTPRHIAQRPDVKPEVRPETRPEVRPEVRPDIRTEKRPDLRPTRHDDASRSDRKEHMYKTVSKLLSRVNHMAEKNGVEIPAEALRDLAAKMTADGKLDTEDRKLFNAFLTRVKNAIADQQSQPDRRAHMAGLLNAQENIADIDA